MLKGMLIRLKLKGLTASRVFFIIQIRIQVIFTYDLSVLGDEDAANKFTQIARAYEVLNDETKR